MTDIDRGTLLFLYRGLTLGLDGGVQPPKAGSLLFCRHLDVRPGERVLEIGSGTGLAAVLAARAGARVIATARPSPARATTPSGMNAGGAALVASHHLAAN